MRERPIGDATGRMTVARRLLPWLPLVAALAMGAAGLWLETLDPRGALTTDPILVPMLASFAAVGGLINSRDRGNSVGWLLSAFSLLVIGSFVSARWAVLGYDHTPPLPGAELGAAFGFGWIMALACPVLIAFVVPTGRPASRRWAVVLRVVILIFAVLTVLFAFGPRWSSLPSGAVDSIGFIPNPIFVPALEGVYAVLDKAFFVYLLIFALGAVALISRFRSSVGIEREQLKWIVAGIVAMVGFMAFSQLPSPIGDLFFALAMLPLPLSLGIAIRRYRLYEIDRIVSRTLAYAVLTGVLGAVFVGSVLLLQELLGPFANGQPIAVAVSTLAVATLFQPLRRWIQAGVDRRFYRARYNATRTLEAFALRLRQEVELGRVNDDLVTTVDAALRPEFVSVWLRRPPPEA
jgi:hypothetical protein